MLIKRLEASRIGSITLPSSRNNVIVVYFCTKSTWKVSCKEQSYNDDIVMECGSQVQNEILYLPLQLQIPYFSILPAGPLLS